MTKRHVAVLMGGVSSEHDISMKTGAMVAEGLSRGRFRVSPIAISRDGQWEFLGERPVSIYEAVPRLRERAIDCVFIALHGPFGEDGRIQSLLDLLGIPYTGSGCAASALAIDKIKAKAVVQQAGVRVAPQIALYRRAWEAEPDAWLARVADELGFPCVIKSPCQGSSLGMAVPQDEHEFPSALRDVMAYGDVVMIEELVRGTEVTCGVLDVEPDAPPRALPVTEIRPVTSAYFDYRAKYTPGACDEITPAEIPDDMARTVQDVAVHAHEVIGCRGLSRSDMILDDDGPVWIEVNTIPGMTETSLFPQAAAAAGIPFPQLVGRLVEAALGWHERAKDTA